VRDPSVHTRVCEEVKAYLAEENWTVRGLTPSPITGPQGNVEFLIWALKT
jgi:23S rRNA (cytidine1920-2'-O)/16S rRNA (cytidine1409-2'-O)-methyltransferase